MEVQIQPADEIDLGFLPDDVRVSLSSLCAVIDEVVDASTLDEIQKESDSCFLESFCSERSKDGEGYTISRNGDDEDEQQKEEQQQLKQLKQQQTNKTHQGQDEQEEQEEQESTISRIFDDIFRLTSADELSNASSASVFSQVTIRAAFAEADVQRLEDSLRVAELERDALKRVLDSHVKHDSMSTKLHRAVSAKMEDLMTRLDATNPADTSSLQRRTSFRSSSQYSDGSSGSIERGQDMHVFALEAQIESLNTRMVKSEQSRREECKSLMANHHKAITNLQHRLDESKQESRDLAVNLAEQRVGMISLESTIDNERTRVKQLEMKLEKTTVTQTESVTQCRIYEARIKDLNGTIDISKDQLNLSDANVARLRSAAIETEVSRRDSQALIRTLTQERNALQETLQQSSATVKQLKEANVRIRRQLDSMSKKHSHDELKREWETAEASERNVLSDTINELKLALERARQNSEKDRVTSASTINDLHQELLVAEQRIIATEERASKAEKTTAQLSIDLGNTIDSENHAQQKLKPLRSANDALVAELKEEQEAHAHTKAQLDIRDDQLNKQALDLGGVKLELAKIRSDEEDTMARLELQVIQATRAGNTGSRSPKNNHAVATTVGGGAKAGLQVREGYEERKKMGRVSSETVKKSGVGAIGRWGSRSKDITPSWNSSFSGSDGGGETVERKDSSERARGTGGQWLLSTLGLS